VEAAKMRRFVFLTLLLMALALTGCASMYDSMGLMTKDAMVARDERLAALEAQSKESSSQVSTLSDSVAKNKVAAEKFVEVENLMKKLEDRVDLLPQETLKRISEILSRVVAETSVP
jgi:uncharacterized coiled-coil protein SlyX